MKKELNYFNKNIEKSLNNYASLGVGMFLLLNSMTCNADEIAQDKSVSNINDMFKNGTFLGNLKLLSAQYEYEKSNQSDTHLSAVGGDFKFELAELNGFGGGVAFSVSHNLGETIKDEALLQNDEITTIEGDYNMMSEAYLNYKSKNLTVSLGRQIMDNPLANADYSRMIPNTFEAYSASYELPKFSFTVGKIVKWQGHDAGLSNGWVKTGENGAYFGGATYADDYTKSNIWYYNITKFADILYLDTALSKKLNDTISADFSLQYLRNMEIEQSGVDGVVYGAMAQLNIENLFVNIASNLSTKKASKAIFSGYGGGTLYTNMDTMILDEIASDRDAISFSSTLGYENENFLLAYAYGDFHGKADSAGVGLHVVEQNIKLKYNAIKDKLYFSLVCMVQRDKTNYEKTDNDWNRFQFLTAYKF